MTAQRQAIMQVHQMSVSQFEEAFQDEDDCKSYLANNRWPVGVCCPRCGAGEVTEHGTRDWHWMCYACAPDGYRFSVLVGTIFENTNKPLREWFRVMHLMLTSKKGISALQVMRYMGFGSYNTALKMCNKIRVALSGADFRQLVGVVECDETFVGGKAKNKHGGNDKGGTGGGHSGNKKEVVIACVERKGNVVARVIANTSKATLDAFVNEVVSHKVSLICTDEYHGYNNVWKLAKHRTVCHSRGEYVNGAVHTNTIEGFWSIVKRGIMGTFHKVSRKYLTLDVAEFEFRYNNRMNADIFGAAIRAC